MARKRKQDTQTDSKETPELLEESPQEEPIQLLEWDGERSDAADLVRERALLYAQHVNSERAVPDVRDGLKVVHRRVLFSMHEQRAYVDRKPKKCARLVGDVIGKYHPHGDAPVYEALVRMAQPFVAPHPLIIGQGNFGSPDDPPAAMRYTEAKLSAIATDMVDDLRPEIVPFSTNYSEDAIEPNVMPVTFPSLIVNGTSGIGVGLACDIPPHNLAEAIDAAILVANDPDATLKQVMKKLPGPDYPTGGIITNPEDLEEAYRTGQGRVKLQAKYHIENMPGGQQAVVVTELPYQVGPEQILRQIIDKAKEEKITEITEKPSNNTSKEGLRLVIKCKRGGNIQTLVAQLLAHTHLAVVRPLNFTVVYPAAEGTLAPRTVGMLDLLRAFVDFRRQVVTKRLEYERDQLLKALHRLTALRAAVDVIDRVIKIIRSSKDDEDSRRQLKKVVKVVPFGMKKAVPIDDQQAQFIIDMRLKRLNQLNRFQLDEEIEQKTERVMEIKRILQDPQAITDIVTDELREVKRKYAQPRKTLLSGELASSVPEDGSAPLQAGERQEVVVFASAQGQAVAAVPKNKWRSAPISLSAQDRLRFVLPTDTHAQLHAFSSGGTCFRVRVADLGVESKKAKGKALCALGRGEELAGLLPAEAEEEFLCFVTARGEVKRLRAEELARSHAGGIACMKVKDDDRIVAVLAHGKGRELLAHTRLGKALRTPLDAINPKGRAAGGMALMRLADGDEIIAACLVEPDDQRELLVVHEHGHAKRMALAEYPTKGRGGGGVASADPSKPAKDPAGAVAFCVPLDGKVKQLRVFTARGQVLDEPLKRVEQAKRPTVSKPWLMLDESDDAAVVSPLG